VVGPQSPGPPPSFGIPLSIIGSAIPACGEEQFIEIFSDEGGSSPAILGRIESVLVQDLHLKKDVHFRVDATSQLLGGIKEGTQVAIIPSNFTDPPTAAANVNSPESQANLLRFVENGGVLVMHMADNLPGDSYQPPMLKPVLMNTTFPPPLMLVSSSHPVALGPDLVAGTTDDWTQTNIQCQDPARVGRCLSMARLLPLLPPDATVIITASGEPVFAEYEIGQGRVILTSIFVESGSAGNPGVIVGDGSPRRILTNELFYATLRGVSGDTDSPDVLSVTAVPNPAASGTTVRLDALVQDEGCGEPGVQAAQFSQDGGPFIAMSPSDGGFDAPSEEAFAELTFTGAGVHELCVTAVDPTGNLSAPVCTLLAVFDPAAGFVTGAGTIDSPLGAYVVDPNLKGLARFAFVSRYQKGATLPDGTTQFTFHVANLDFRSSNYEWLVVAGSRAQFKGLGMINGSGDFGFLLTAIDGDLKGGDGGPDGFRIKIWDRSNDDTVVYDNKVGYSDGGNEVTDLLGGSIRIHNR
jgi:hypothetical protein